MIQSLIHDLGENDELPLKKEKTEQVTNHITSSLHLSSVLASSPQCKLVLHNIDNYISNDAYKISGGADIVLWLFTGKHTLSAKHIFLIYVSIWVPTPTLASVNFCLTVRTPSEGDAPSKSGMT